MKMKYTKIIKAWGTAFFVILFFSCGFNEYEETQEQENITYIEESSIFTQSEEKPGEYFFSVSDRKYSGTEGSTFWIVCEKDSTEQGEFKEFTAEVTKSSGNTKVGYGLVFCQSENEKNEQSLLCVLINVNGFYCIGKLDENSFEKISDWTFSSSLNAGYTSNTISILRNTDKFELFFNGVFETEFFDKNPVLSIGGRGFVAVVSPDEKFPEQSVSVRYRIIN